MQTFQCKGDLFIIYVERSIALWCNMNFSIIGSGKDVLLLRRHSIIWTHADSLHNGHIETSFLRFETT